MLDLYIGMSDLKYAMSAKRALEHQALRANSIAPSFKTPMPDLHNIEFDELASMPTGEYDGEGKHTLFDHLKHPMKGFGEYMEGGIRTGRYEGEGATPSMGLFPVWSAPLRRRLTTRPGPSRIE